MNTHYRPLRLNVGFLLSQTAGYGRLFDFHEDRITLGSDIRVEAFTGHLQLNRTPQGIVVLGDFSAQLPAECARCLKAFSAPVSTHLEDLFVYPPQNATDPLLVVGEDAYLNLEPLVREYLMINAPIQPLCRPDCKGLCPICGNDLNEQTCSHPEEAEVLGILASGLSLSAGKKSATANIAQPVRVRAPRKIQKKAVRAKAAAAEKPPKKRIAKPIVRKSGGKSPAGRKSAGGTAKKTSKKK
jgi:uncharacterized protein